MIFINGAGGRSLGPVDYRLDDGVYLALGPGGVLSLYGGLVFRPCSVVCILRATVRPAISYR